MASTDIAGSVIVILSEEEARCVFRRLHATTSLNIVEQGLYRKIVRDLKIESTEYAQYRHVVMGSEDTDLHPEA